MDDFRYKFQWSFVFLHGIHRRMDCLFFLFFFVFWKNLTLSEIFRLLEDEENTCDVFIQPPDANELIDKDSGKKGESERLQTKNFPGNKLLAPAELSQRRCNVTEDK